MCGIAGFTGPGNRSVLLAMTESLRHRGPDSVGLLGRAGRVPRACAALPSSMSRPASSRSSTRTNDRRGLQRRDLQPRRSSRAELDTRRSSLLHRPFRHRSDCPSLRGATASISSASSTACSPSPYGTTRSRRLVLARDRLGIKPLYFARCAGGVAFGSEPKALLQHPAVSRTPNFRRSITTCRSRTCRRR